ncbi:MAG: beta-lactamase family protein [Clostridia bacterium]|nr:beta-lactamase family protein [Clostridia bacterium]
MKDKLSATKKIVVGVMTPITAIVLIFSILCIATTCMYSATFLNRVVLHWDSSVEDYKIFPKRVIQKSENPYAYTESINQAVGDINVEYSNKKIPLNEFINKTKTTSFIVVKNDEIIYRQYANGYDENSTFTSFSMAKSIVSLLIGKAIEDGYIDSVNQPISVFITEFKDKPIGNTTIEQLLLMRSNIAYDEDKFLWFGDDTLTYWYDDLRQLALNHTKLTDKYNGAFHYNNYHPLLLGIILERSTGVSVSQYFQSKIWQKIGAEYDASWSLDSEKTGFEKMESGINFNAVDFMKIGSMVLHDGYWNGQQIINGDWLDVSTSCEFPLNNYEYKNSFLDDKNIGYKYMWYSVPTEQSRYDIVAWGKSDQILYISPANNIVVLRTGKTDGGVDNWVEVIKDIIANINAVS